MKAMILAAGRGTRMGKLTELTPKALLKAGGEALIERRIRRLAEFGIKKFVINLYGAAKQIPDVLGDGSAMGVSIEYSLENKVLETAGGIIQALPLIGKNPFIICSCDTITDYDFSKLLKHRLHGSLGHLILTDNPDHHRKGDYAINKKLLSLEKEPKLTYAGFGI